jgi:hypothetical protein
VQAKKKGYGRRLFGLARSPSRAPGTHLLNLLGVI